MPLTCVDIGVLSAVDDAIAPATELETAMPRSLLAVQLDRHLYLLASVLQVS